MAPGRIRTPDPLIRSQMLYPAELQAPMGREMGLNPRPLESQSSALPVELLPLSASRQKYFDYVTYQLG